MISFERARMDSFLEALEKLSAGDLTERIPITSERDELDAVAHGINVLAGELAYRFEQLHQAQSSLIQSAKLAALGEVCSGLAHELNNPLAIIRGFVEHSLILVEPDSDLATYLQKIDGGVDRMSAIIQHVREFSRQSKPRMEPVAVNEPLQSACMLIREQLRLKNIQVQLNLSPGDPWIQGDRLRLEQVFLNLLTNARDAISKAHGETGGQIRITSRPSQDQRVEIEIADNGCGMKAEVLERMFDPFFTTKEVGSGTGLGLSISLGIVQEHGGEIVCETVPGPAPEQGSRIRILIPRLIR